MKTSEFLDRINHSEISAVIQQAELVTSGEIRVYITRHPVETPVIEAQRCFMEQGMEKTRERNGVLIFVAPRTQKFAIVGDAGIHTHCGDEFWQGVANEMSADFRQGDFTAGLVKGVTKAGELLARHFPRRPDDQNELSNSVVRD